MNIYLLKEGARQGPYSVDQVVDFIRNGDCLMSDLAWREGMNEWCSIHAMKDIVNLVLPPIPSQTKATSSEQMIADQLPSNPTPAQLQGVKKSSLRKLDEGTLFILAVIGLFGAGIGGVICESIGDDNIGALILFCILGAVIPILAALVLMKTGLLKNDARQQDNTGKVSDSLPPNNNSNQPEFPDSVGKKQVKHPKREIAVGIACIIGSAIWISVCTFLFYATLNDSRPAEQLGLRVGQNNPQFVDLAAIHEGTNSMYNAVTEPTPAQPKPVNAPKHVLFHIPNLIAFFIGIRLFIFGCSKFKSGVGKDEIL